MTDGTPVAHELVVWRRGVAVSWRDAYGPAVALSSSPNAATATGAMHLPAGETAGDGPPSLAASGRGVAAAWVDREAGMLALIDPGGGLHAPPLAVHHGARAIAVGATGEMLVVASTDADGIVVSWVDVQADPQVVDTRRVVATTDVASELRVLPVDHGVLVLYLADGRRRLGITRVDVDPQHPPSDVRHPLRGAAATVRAASVRGHCAVALSYEPEHASRVDLVLLDPSGRTRERPHAVMTQTGARFVDAHPVWIETGFVVAAVDESSGHLHLASVPEGRAPTARVRAEPGPTRMAFWQRRLVVTRLSSTGQRLSLAVRRLDERGGQDGTSHVEVTPPDTPWLAARHSARGVLDDVQARLVGRGYRDAGRSTHRSEDGLELWLRSAAGPSRIRAAVDHAGVRLDLVVGPEGADLSEEIPPEPSLVRLARWVRRTFSREAAQALEEERTWARETFSGARVARMDRAGPVLAVTLSLQDRPAPQQVLGWLDAMHERLRDARAHEEVAAGGESA